MSNELFHLSLNTQVHVLYIHMWERESEREKFRSINRAWCRWTRGKKAHYRLMSRRSFMCLLLSCWKRGIIPYRLRIKLWLGEEAFVLLHYN